MKILEVVTLPLFLTLLLGVSFKTSAQAPVLAEAKFISHNGVHISWTGLAGITAYRVDISTDNFETFVPGFENYSATIAQPTTGPVLWNFIGLNAETSYQVRVKAELGGAFSDYSNSITFTTREIPPQASSLSWQFGFGSDGSDQVARMTIGSDGFLYVVGYFEGNLNVEGNIINGLGKRDGYVAKFSTDGNLEWIKVIQGTGNEEIWAVTTDSHSLYLYGVFNQAINVDINGGTSQLDVRGVETGLPQDNGDGFLASYDLSTLTLEWSISLGDAFPITGNPIQSDGTNLYLTGVFYRDNDFDPDSGVHQLSSKGDDDVFIAAYNALNGALNWAHSFGGDGSGDWGYSILIEGDYLFACGFYSFNVDLDPGPSVVTAPNGGGFFSKFNKADGSLIWAKAIAGGAGTYGNILDMAIKGGAIFLAGDYRGFVDFDTGPNEKFITSNSNSDGFFGKYSVDSGDLIWVKTMTGSGSSTDDLSLRKIVVDDNSVYVAGNSVWSSNFNSDPGGAFRTSFATDIFLASYQQSDGSFNWAKTIGGSGFDFIRGGLTMNTDAVFIGAKFTGLVNFNPYQGSSFYSGNNDYSAVARYDLEGATPEIPTGLSASQITFNSTLISWNNSVNTTSYRIDLTKDHFQTYVASYSNWSVSGTKLVLEGLEPGTVYEFRVRAVNSAGISENSLIGEFSTKGLQTISFAEIVDQTITIGSFVLDVTASSGLPLTLETTTPEKISIDGKTVTLLNPGFATIVASQDGSEEFEAAPDVERSFCVLPEKPDLAIIPGVISSSSATGNQWLLNGEVLTSETSNQITPTVEGNYSVKVIIEGCESEASDGFQFVITGLEDEFSKLGIDPNPVRSFLKVNTTEFDSFSLRNNQGIIMEVPVEEVGDSRIIDVRNVPPGPYLLSFRIKGRVKHIKIIKL